jgi:uncharacterized membrane protein
MVYISNEYFVYFIIYSFVGWLIESIAFSITRGHFVYRGSLKGPFLPTYGTGALFLFAFLNFFANNKITLYFISVVLMTLWEYFVHWLLEVTFKKKWWDYSTYFFNIHGRVCLLYSLCWGLLGIIFVIYLHPLIVKIVTDLELLSPTIFNYVAYTLLIVFLLDVIFYISKIIKEKNN